VAQSLFGPSPVGPVERAVAQGDEGEGRGLKIVVSQDVPGPSAARSIPRTAPRETRIPAPRGLKVAMAEPKPAAKATAKAKAAAKADKESLDKIAKVRAEADCAKAKGAKAKKACKAEEKEVKLAAKDDCAKAKGAKAKKACKAEDVKLAAKDEKTAKKDKGGWAVQVGAFKGKDDAKAQLTKMAKAHGRKLADADAEVSGKGVYRARFTGMTAQEAKAACKAIAAKGGKCLALAVNS
jgi:cell division septation protein DedD